MTRHIRDELWLYLTLTISGTLEWQVISPFVTCRWCSVLVITCCLCMYAWQGTPGMNHDFIYYLIKIPRTLEWQVILEHAGDAAFLVITCCLCTMTGHSGSESLYREDFSNTRLMHHKRNSLHQCNVLHLTLFYLTLFCYNEYWISIPAAITKRPVLHCNDKYSCFDGPWKITASIQGELIFRKLPHHMCRQHLMGAKSILLRHFDMFCRYMFSL